MRFLLARAPSYPSSSNTVINGVSPAAVRRCCSGGTEGPFCPARVGQDSEPRVALRAVTTDARSRSAEGLALGGGCAVPQIFPG